MSEIRCTSEIEIHGATFQCAAHWDPDKEGGARTFRDAHGGAAYISLYAHHRSPYLRAEARPDGLRATVEVTWMTDMGNEEEVREAGLRSVGQNESRFGHPVGTASPETGGARPNEP